MKAAVVNRLRWTVKEYFRLAEAEVLDNRRVELIDGDLVETPPQTHPHLLAVTRLSRLLLNTFGPSSYWVVLRGTLVLPRYGAPDPDFHVFDTPEGARRDRLPFLVIEVSDTTYRNDSGPKLRMYARAGIQDYWIVNLPEQRVEVYRQPENPTRRRSGWRYAAASFHSRGEKVRPLHRPQVTFAVDAMLP